MNTRKSFKAPVSMHFWLPQPQTNLYISIKTEGKLTFYPFWRELKNQLKQLLLWIGHWLVFYQFSFYHLCQISNDPLTFKSHIGDVASYFCLFPWRLRGWIFDLFCGYISFLLWKMFSLVKLFICKLDLTISVNHWKAAIKYLML